MPSPASLDASNENKTQSHPQQRCSHCTTTTSIAVLLNTAKKHDTLDSDVSQRHGSRFSVLFVPSEFINVLEYCCKEYNKSATDCETSLSATTWLTKSTCWSLSGDGGGGGGGEVGVGRALLHQVQLPAVRVAAAAAPADGEDDAGEGGALSDDDDAGVTTIILRVVFCTLVSTTFTQSLSKDSARFKAKCGRSLGRNSGNGSEFRLQPTALLRGTAWNPICQSQKMRHKSITLHHKAFISVTDFRHFDSLAPPCT